MLYQTLCANIYWNKSQYPLWDSVSENYLVSLDELSTQKVTGLSGLSDFSNSNISIQNFGQSDAGLWHFDYFYFDQESYALNESNDELHVTFRRSDANYLYENFTLEFSGWHSNIPNYNDSNSSGFVRNGFVVDMRDNFVIRGKINIPSGFDSDTDYDFVLSANLFDIHGHELNSEQTQIVIEKSEFGHWVDFEINYAQITANSEKIGDNKSIYFNTLKNPLLDMNSIVPIDTAHIAGVNFCFMPGIKGNFISIIKIKDIEIGDGSNAMFAEEKSMPNSNNSKEEVLSFYPNPAFDFITINNQAVKISIHTFNGLPLLTQNITDNNNTVYISELLKGTYFINIYMKDGTIRQETLIKE